MKKGRFAIGAIVGAGAGIVAGILTAPKSGKETRADLKEKATELKEEAAKRGNTTKNKAEEVIEEVKERADDYKTRGEHAVNGAIEGAKKGFNDKKK